jgi:tetratricopeptide (TPR) repeat protein/transglutaminase-like putative cysteine protease
MEMMRRVWLRFLPWGLVVLCVIGFANVVYGQDADWSLTGPAFSASPVQILAAAAKVKHDPTTDATVLFEDEHYTIDAQGRVVHTHHLIYRIDTQAGVDGWSSVAVEWEAFYQKRPEIHARVIQPNGSVTELDPKTITDTAANNADLEEGTYSDDRVLTAPLPALAAGTIVEEETTVVDEEPFFSGGGVYRNYFERNVPIALSRLVVETPDATPLQYRLHDMPNAQVDKETAKGMRTVTFSLSHLKPIVSSDIPLVTPDIKAPWVDFSTGKSWHAVAKAYAQLADPQILPDQVKSLLPANLPKDRNARAAVLVAILHKQVRYTGIEFGKAKLQPRTPKEVLARGYGDCKDKAAFLVAMLRAAGIPADLALLQAGPGNDVNPDLPGMNRFDHAIVYVPGDAAHKPLWIDATAEYTKVGELPYGDQNRRALIIAPGTQGLTLTPQATPEDSVLVETREFDLADYGSAKVVETSQTSGYIDASYRDYYQNSDNVQVKQSLDTYAKEVYAAKSPIQVTHGNAHDLTKPFDLRIVVPKAGRGHTGVLEAQAALYPTSAYSALPGWFGRDPSLNRPKAGSPEEERLLKEKQQRSDVYQIAPFITERIYKLVPPPGFVVRGLPQNQRLTMGPATLTETYSKDAKGVVTADYKFDTGKAIYSLADVLALRDAVVQADQGSGVIVTFDQAGAKLMAQGKVREAFVVDRKAIAADPQSALPHVRFAYALLSAGVGGEARGEAQQAVKLEPKSKVAWQTLGWMSQFDSIGQRFGPGFDLDGAIAAYQQAKAIDPDDINTRFDLALLYEYDKDGQRYASQSGLDKAIAEYRALMKRHPQQGKQYEDNLLFDLLYAHHYKQLLTELNPLQDSATHDALGVAAVAASQGIPAALQRAASISGSTPQQDAALVAAGGDLVRLRMYSDAAKLLSAGLQGQQDAASLARRIQIFSSLKPFDVTSYSKTGPAGVVRRIMVDQLTDNLSDAEVSEVLTKHAYANEAAWQKNLKEAQKSQQGFRVLASVEGLPMPVMRDSVLGMMKISSEGNDKAGYRVTVQSLGTPSRQFYVVHEPDGYRVVAEQTDTAEVGNEVLYLLEQGNEAEARALLNWRRNFAHLGGGDDPLEGMLFPRFWTTGESGGKDDMRLAAISLLLGNEELKAKIPEIEQLRSRAKDRIAAEQLLDSAYLEAENYRKAKTLTEELLKKYPDSDTAIAIMAETDSRLGDAKAAYALVKAHLAKNPDDRRLIVTESMIAQDQGDFAGAAKILQGLLNSGNANASDYNDFAWNSLFENKVDSAALQAAQQANLLTSRGNFAILHTLGCVYAAQGKTAEARETAKQAMRADDLAEPNSDVWFLYGLIYQQYGANHAAIAAFRKVKKPQSPISSTDTYVLAQKHLKDLQAM